jgi:hypothetical protein
LGNEKSGISIFYFLLVWRASITGASMLRRTLSRLLSKADHAAAA